MFPTGSISKFTVRSAEPRAHSAVRSALLVMEMELTTSCDGVVALVVAEVSVVLGVVALESGVSPPPQETSANSANAVNGINVFFIIPPIPKNQNKIISGPTERMSDC